MDTHLFAVCLRTESPSRCACPGPVGSQIHCSVSEEGDLYRLHYPIPLHCVRPERSMAGDWKVGGRERPRVSPFLHHPGQLLCNDYLFPRFPLDFEDTVFFPSLFDSELIVDFFCLFVFVC